MKIISLFLTLLLSLYVSGQSAEELLANLPNDVKNSISQQASKDIDISNIQLQDNLTMPPDTEVQNNPLSEPFFGYSFFETNSETTTPIVDVPLPANYVLNLNDQLELLLVGNKQNIFKLRIDMSGNVLIPELGSISLAGLELEQANEKIQVLINESYIGTSSYLSVSNPSLKKISVVGAVKNPGTYLVNPFISLTEAIKYAGGLMENSSLRNVKVVGLEGTEKNLDLYTFLIAGDRQKDINLQNGDTVVIDASSNFLDIKGSVKRPMVYEYSKDDTYKDLISFALGFERYANKESINLNVVIGNVERTLKPNLEDVIGEKDVLELYIGSKEVIKKKSVFVDGSSVSNGFYDFVEGESLVTFLQKLKFSDDIYPFYATITQSYSSGLANYFEHFSLVDPNTYAGINLLENPVINFFSKE